LDAPALIDLSVSIYFASKTRWVHLEKAAHQEVVWVAETPAG
jgi:predicted metal-dependent HD superfamily phosphohydrolase